MSELPRLADFVQPTLSEARIQRQWSRINRTSGAQRHWRFGWYAAALGAAATVVWSGHWLLRHQWGERVTHAGGMLVVEHDSSGGERLTMPEGVTVSLKDLQSRYVILERSPRSVHLQLDRGTIELDVTPDKQRQVVVSAAGFDVEVVGTHFEVALTGSGKQADVAVRVQRGIVRVHQTGQPPKISPIRTLAAGESWSTHSATEERASAPTPVVEVPSESAASSAWVPAPANPAPATAKELFEAAEAARIKGRPREAAAVLDKLRRLYPSDPRAGLACFELGRLRMDQLGEPAMAASAFLDALRLDPSGRFREDAQARLVQIYHSLGQIDRCRQAQANYAKQYPNGSHAKGVSSLCTR